MAYELDFPSSHIHKVFYVYFLKRVLGQTMLAHMKILELDKDENFILELEKVIHWISFTLQNKTIMEYLIKWKNMHLEKATWEGEQFMTMGR